MLTNTIAIDNTRFIFQTNFSGDPNNDRFGDSRRKANIMIPDPEQAKDLINYIKAGKSDDGGVWNTNIFGKTVEQLVEEGIRAKIVNIGDECQLKLQDTMQKIVNDSSGGMVCIII